MPDLAESVDIGFSDRMRASLGRCRPAQGRVVLSGRLRTGPRARVHEVLCHELAHVAVHRLHGPDAAPHGTEWKALVRAAGYEPSVRACVVEAGRTETDTATATATGGAASEFSGAVATSRANTARFAHRCPVCHTVRYARAPVNRWRCAECLDAGLDGHLEITSEPAPVP